MKRKALNASSIIGIVLGLIGALFAVLGSIFMINIQKLRAVATGTGDIIMLPLMFLGFGFTMLMIAALIIALSVLKENRIRRMIAEGHYIYATVTDIVTNFNVSINGRHPYFIECRYEDPYTSETYMFRSQNIMYRPNEIMNTEIRVWVDRNNYSLYRVDIDKLIQ